MTKGAAVTNTRLLVIIGVSFLGGIVGGLLSGNALSSGVVQAQKPNGVNAEEFLLLDARGKARAGLGLDANGEVGLVLSSKDGNRTLRLSPDNRQAIRIEERGGRLLWGAP